MQKNINILITKAAIAVVSLLSLLCICILGIDACISGLSTQSSNGPTPILEKTNDYGQDYVNQIVFLGDSTTYGLKYYGVLKDGKNTKQVWTGEGGTLTLSSMITQTAIVYPETGELITIPEAVARKKPKYMVITLGVNGVAMLEKDQFIKSYKKLVNAVKEASPDTKIILQSIFPVTSEYSNSGSGITNEKITKANTWVLQVAKECDVKYLDTQSVLKNSSGSLNTSLCNDNKLHLNEAGLRKELEYIRTHGYVD